ncbi:MAG: hypothetical protein G3M70_03990 [Candidatus Nitronauta litoralis]|uniref:PpiC domain-containing protein n=1 Tax=Candidatus Nitronauta litoralis TaxID=2705533 RepID=A0A7T0BUL2_9BACT|nr:MAG: hypothetical protein G3M70_03990 [Candidatus Nitronauta litoralis]
MKAVNTCFLRLLVVGIICLTLTLPSSLWAHAGHDHGDNPKIALPDVVAKVNGKNIAKDAILTSLKASIKKYKAKGMPMSPDQEKIAAKKLIDNQINRHLLLTHAEKQGIKVTPEAIEKRFNRIKKGFSSDAQFKKKLEAEGLSVADYKKELEGELKIEAILKKELGKGINVSDKIIKSYYEKNQKRYSSPEQRRASIMLIKVKKGASPEQENRAKEMLEDVLEEIREGKDFGKLAKLHSQDTLASRGGDLGFFEKKKMLKAFSDQAFALKLGEVSGIFRTRHGFQILKLTDIKPAVSQSLDEVKEEIRDILIGMEIKKNTPDYLTRLKKEANIKTYF